MSSAFPAHPTVVVTGAGSPRGIGRVVATRFAERGWAVACMDIDEDGAARTAEAIRGAGASAIGIAADITDAVSVDAAFQRIERELPPVVAVINVAGIASPVPFAQLDLTEWHKVFAVNSTGTFLVTHRAMPGMLERGLGRVVNISSASAQRGGGTYSKVAYSASKAAVLGFTRALAREVGRAGVTVNAVSPGPIDTDIMGGELSDARRAELIEELTVDRLGAPEDIAAAVEFLAGPDSGYITGTTLNVNGGLIID